MITIIDYEMGNAGSIQNMFKYLGVKSQVESDSDKIRHASKLLLLRVGSFDMALNKIKEKNLEEVFIWSPLNFEEWSNIYG